MAAFAAYGIQNLTGSPLFSIALPGNDSPLITPSMSIKKLFNSGIQSKVQEWVMPSEKIVAKKIHDLIYPRGTPPLNMENSLYLGKTMPKDIPDGVDEFYRLWFKHFNDFTKKFGGFRDTIESLLSETRFISYTEYTKIFKDRDVVREQNALARNPALGVANIKNNAAKQRFINLNLEGLKGYFELMKLQNRALYDMFHAPKSVRLPHKLQSEHTYIVAGTGSGKSELIKHMVIHNVRQENCAVIVIDPKGVLSEQIAKQLDIPPKRLVYVQFDDPELTARINPFQMIRSDNPIEMGKQVQVIRDTLTQIFEEKGADKSTPQHTLLEACIDVIAKRKGTLKDLLRFFTPGLHDDLLAEGKQNPNHREFFQTMFNDPSMGVSKLSLYKKMKDLLGTLPVSDFFGGETTINLRKAIDKKKVIVFNLGTGAIGTFASEYIGRMMIAVIQNLIFQRVKIPEKDRVPLKIYIDEFQKFVNESSEQIFVQGREFGVSLIVASQITGQKMSTEMTRIVLGNTYIKFVGSNGYDTLRTMSRENYVEMDELTHLGTGEFFCRIGNATGFIQKQK